jgi:hypothetical protein
MAPNGQARRFTHSPEGQWGDIGSSSVQKFTRMTDFPILEGEKVTLTTG